ncbi:GGDEF domain-containing protein [Methylosinus sp. PW1]|uniref:GGDEF domain-containing protein n=1 Tax=Methylosinus sp. PW1 TaxID=107636 RepID=UPI0005646030|nr:GGDEF domain-containing protein [Methylosinus sp. PW1]
MWRRLGHTSRNSAPLPDAAYVELVDMVARPVMPVAFMGIALACVGLLLASRKQDWALLALTLAGVAVDIASVFLVLAYQRRAAQATILADEARVWERRYAIGLFSFAALLGAINARALMMAHPPESSLVPMLTSGLAFVFAGGVVSNVAFRPRLCAVGLALSATPTVIGLVVRATEASDIHILLGFVLQAVLLSAFAVVGLFWAAETHAATRRQIISKLDFAKMARHDDLTGLANRVELRERFDEASTRLGPNEYLAIHCLDLDRFKAVNDAYGHLTGDLLLCAATARLLTMVRREDTAARLGGDEFVVLQTGVRHPDEALLLARRIVRVLGAPYEIEGRSIQIGVSIGVALAPRDGLTLEQLVTRADAALYRMKRGGRGGVVFAEEPPPPSAANDS